MKKKLAGLALILGALALSAACATSGSPSGTKRTEPPQLEPGENWARAATSVGRQRFDDAASSITRLGTRGTPESEGTAGGEKG